jgi:hypothetical protein
MKGYDAFAGVIKSGARRAARQDGDPGTPNTPDILDFMVQGERGA